MINPKKDMRIYRMVILTLLIHDKKLKNAESQGRKQDIKPMAHYFFCR
jgi:hypothetical protein